MENDAIGTVELVSTETTGYLGPNGEFIHGEPPAQKSRELPVYVQEGEDVVGD